jgi:hypothetical protein
MRLKSVCMMLGVCVVHFPQAALAAQRTPEDLALLWVEAIKTNSTIKIRPNTPEERAKYGLGKGFPIAKASGGWFFVICMKSA